VILEDELKIYIEALAKTITIGPTNLFFRLVRVNMGILRGSRKGNPVYRRRLLTEKFFPEI